MSQPGKIRGDSGFYKSLQDEIERSLYSAARLRGSGDYVGIQITNQVYKMRGVGKFERVRGESASSLALLHRIVVL